MSEQLSSSLEDYLETILLILQETQSVRAKEIATRMGVRNSSVTGALRMLADKGLIVHEPYGGITLTPQGYQVALGVLQRHRILSDFFVHVLQIDPILAEETACQMEHALTQPILERLTEYLTFMESCPNTRVVWNAELGFLCSHDCGLAEETNCSHVLQTPGIMGPVDTGTPASLVPEA
ncbi:metal-dependent transcriptional regulator [Myxococcota bacterium]|nr:metal-dependent transcriptional regulator [Myxococcota bacterium]MBU1410675.1 metal-dependent transcriptional regulator [Myxococcota bacterium]MBU1509475.1 metal-dependent transcriptional regulator [Myxococcota bacterium]